MIILVNKNDGLIAARSVNIMESWNKETNIEGQEYSHRYLQIAHNLDVADVAHKISNEYLVTLWLSEHFWI